MTVRVDHGVSAGTFSLDGETFEVENNLWVVGDDRECVVIDAPHSVDDILALVGERTVKAILLTHAHDDHCRMAPELRSALDAPIMLHPADRPLWELTHGELWWDQDLSDGTQVSVGGTVLQALHTPGHAPGGTCFAAKELGRVFTGDTLFNGGPGATGRSYSDLATLQHSIAEKLFVLAGDTIVHTGHGEDTTIGEERRNAAGWITKLRMSSRLPGEESVP